MVLLLRAGVDMEAPGGLEAEVDSLVSSVVGCAIGGKSVERMDEPVRSGMGSWRAADVDIMLRALSMRKWPRTARATAFPLNI